MRYRCLLALLLPLAGCSEPINRHHSVIVGAKTVVQDLRDRDFSAQLDFSSLTAAENSMYRILDEARCAMGVHQLATIQAQLETAFKNVYGAPPSVREIANDNCA